MDHGEFRIKITNVPERDLPPGSQGPLPSASPAARCASQLRLVAHPEVALSFRGARIDPGLIWFIPWQAAALNGISVVYLCWLTSFYIAVQFIFIVFYKIKYLNSF